VIVGCDRENFKRADRVATVEIDIFLEHEGKKQ